MDIPRSYAQTKKCFSLFHQDTGIKGGREGNLAFSRTFSELLPHGSEHALNEFSMMDEQRNMDDVIPVGRRDIDSKQVFSSPLIIKNIYI